ncbi:hypothetical protein M427DRAFT_473924 [Gonapodya prolifera JEL478]|uniref:Uncharacterized protein n=1 Tax=Gonapodya prolifera (strain JEL478) TaxID=1344416 RepID=A0A139ARD3_GONPJ|nr:hypothetical protein M427DRAFT_473924 [Gonapodya prolifera JEL478]|eukprot:KXS19311.1 hypothetical protein M427DRAFT_473924 [Gonapodya prolifera JEL478]
MTGVRKAGATGTGGEPWVEGHVPVPGSDGRAGARRASVGGQPEEPLSEAERQMEADRVLAMQLAQAEFGLRRRGRGAGSGGGPAGTGGESEARGVEKASGRGAGGGRDREKRKERESVVGAEDDAERETKSRFRRRSAVGDGDKATVAVDGVRAGSASDLLDFAGHGHSPATSKSKSRSRTNTRTSATQHTLNATASTSHSHTLHSVHSTPSQNPLSRSPSPHSLKRKSPPPPLIPSNNHKRSRSSISSLNPPSPRVPRTSLDSVASVALSNSTVPSLAPHIPILFPASPSSVSSLSTPPSPPDTALPLPIPVHISTRKDPDLDMDVDIESITPQPARTPTPPSLPTGLTGGHAWASAAFGTAQLSRPMPPATIDTQPHLPGDPTSEPKLGHSTTVTESGMPSDLRTRIGSTSVPPPAEPYTVDPPTSEVRSSAPPAERVTEIMEKAELVKMEVVRKADGDTVHLGNIGTVGKDNLDVTSENHNHATPHCPQSTDAVHHPIMQPGLVATIPFDHSFPATSKPNLLSLSPTATTFNGLNPLVLLADLALALELGTAPTSVPIVPTPQVARPAKQPPAPQPVTPAVTSTSSQSRSLPKTKPGRPTGRRQGVPVDATTPDPPEKGWPMPGRIWRVGARTGSEVASGHNAQAPGDSILASLDIIDLPSRASVAPSDISVDVSRGDDGEDGEDEDAGDETEPSGPVDPASAKPGTREVQRATCNSARYRVFERCKACVGRQTGEGCRFRGGCGLGCWARSEDEERGNTREELGKQGGERGGGEEERDRSGRSGARNQ